MGSSSTVAVAQPNQPLFFSEVPDDILVNILCRLDGDPCDLARLACVSTRFCRVIKTVCWKSRCEKTVPLLVAELLQPPFPALHPLSEPTGGWASLQKLLVCCPGLLHAGVLLERWDFGLYREDQWLNCPRDSDGVSCSWAASQTSKGMHFCTPFSKKIFDADIEYPEFLVECNATRSDAGTACVDVDGFMMSAPGDVSRMAEKHMHNESYDREVTDWNGHEPGVVPNEVGIHATLNQGNLSKVGYVDREACKQKHRHKSFKRPRECPREDCHVATGPMNLSREQGNKLLANRFRADCLYICDLPGCIHQGSNRVYKLFRGVFKNFKSSHVWRNLKDMKAKARNVGCAFCTCKYTWDMVTSFCLKRSIVFYDDGEPVVRAYVCENGHVAGAWTDRHMYMS